MSRLLSRAFILYVALIAGFDFAPASGADAPRHTVAAIRTESEANDAYAIEASVR